MIYSINIFFFCNIDFEELSDFIQETHNKPTVKIWKKAIDNQETRNELQLKYFDLSNFLYINFIVAKLSGLSFILIQEANKLLDKNINQINKQIGLLNDSFKSSYYYKIYNLNKLWDHSIQILTDFCISIYISVLYL